MNFDEAWGDTCSTVGLACRAGDVATLRLLLAADRPVDVKDNRGWNPLHEAAHGGHLECVQLICDHEKGCIDAITNDYRTAIMLAACGGHVDVCRFLIDRGAILNVTDSFVSVYPLKFAIEEGHLDCVRLFVEAGCELDGTDVDGSTPLHLAIEFARSEIVEWLLDRGAAVDVQDSHGRTAVFVSAHESSERSLKAVLVKAVDEKIVAKVIDFAAFDGTTPLMIAAQKGSVECVRLLLENGADANVVATDFSMALHLSIVGKSVDCVRLLLGRTDRQILRSVTWQPECNLALFAVDPCTCWACRGGDDAVPRRVQNFDLTRLHCLFDLAVGLHDEGYDVLQCLLDSDLDPNESLAHDPNDKNDMHELDWRPFYTNYVGITALGTATAMFDDRMVRMLLDGGCRANPGAGHVALPLDYAVIDGWLEGVKLLLERGADPNGYFAIKGPRRMFCYIYSPTDHDELLLMLRRAGGDVRILFTHYYKPALFAKLHQCKRRDDGLDVISQLLQSVGFQLRRELFNNPILVRKTMDTYVKLSLKQLCATVIRNAVLDSRPPAAFGATVDSLGLPPTVADFVALRRLE